MKISHLSGDPNPPIPPGLFSYSIFLNNITYSVPKLALIIIVTNCIEMSILLHSIQSGTADSQINHNTKRKTVYSSKLILLQSIFTITKFRMNYNTDGGVYLIIDRCNYSPYKALWQIPILILTAYREKIISRN